MNAKKFEKVLLNCRTLTYHQKMLLASSIFGSDEETDSCFNFYLGLKEFNEKLQSFKKDALDD